MSSLFLPTLSPPPCAPPAHCSNRWPGFPACHLPSAISHLARPWSTLETTLEHTLDCVLVHPRLLLPSLWVLSFFVIELVAAIPDTSTYTSVQAHKVPADWSSQSSSSFSSRSCCCCRCCCCCSSSSSCPPPGPPPPSFQLHIRLPHMTDIPTGRTTYR